VLLTPGAAGWANFMSALLPEADMCSAQADVR
jgi:hypothetical protein